MFELYARSLVGTSLRSVHSFCLLGLRARKAVRAELVEACGDELGDAQSPATSSEFVRLCPSTGSGRTDLFTASVIDQKLGGHS